MACHMETNTPQNFPQYWDMIEKLTSDNGLLLKGSKIVIPPVFKESFVHDLQKEHIDITNYQLMVRSLIYWSCINRDIEDFIKWCPIYIKLLPILPAETLINHGIPQGPWQKISADLINCDNKRYLLLIDYSYLPIYSFLDNHD